MVIPPATPWRSSPIRSVRVSFSKQLLVLLNMHSVPQVRQHPTMAFCQVEFPPLLNFLVSEANEFVLVEVLVHETAPVCGHPLEFADCALRQVIANSHKFAIPVHIFLKAFPFWLEGFPHLYLFGCRQVAGHKVKYVVPHLLEPPLIICPPCLKNVLVFLWQTFHECNGLDGGVCCSSSMDKAGGVPFPAE